MVKNPKKERPDYSRRSFVEVEAPRAQSCACPCAKPIQKGQKVFARPYVEKGKLRGYTRIIDMNHYDDWFESIAHETARTIMSRRPETKSYFEMDELGIPE